MNLQPTYVVRLLLPPLLLFGSSIPAETPRTQNEIIISLSTQSGTVTVFQSTGILVQVYTPAGDAVVGQEIILSTDLGRVEPDRTVSGLHGEVWVTFFAAGQRGVSHITASSGGISELIEVTVAASVLPWMVFMFPCLLGLFGIAAAAGVFRRYTKKPTK